MKTMMKAIEMAKEDCNICGSGNVKFQDFTIAVDWCPEDGSKVDIVIFQNGINKMYWQEEM